MQLQFNRATDAIGLTKAIFVDKEVYQRWDEPVALCRYGRGARGAMTIAEGSGSRRVPSVGIRPQLAIHRYALESSDRRRLKFANP